MSVSIIGFLCLILLIFLRIPIAFAMGFVGVFGFLYLNDYNTVAALSMASRRVINTSQDYGLSVIPLFILMGTLVTRAGM
jgi:TRAP-type mannitol/chloroaromatic compound transport system permease large subunit